MTKYVLYIKIDLHRFSQSLVDVLITCETKGKVGPNLLYTSKFFFKV